MSVDSLIINILMTSCMSPVKINNKPTIYSKYILILAIVLQNQSIHTLNQTWISITVH